MYEVGIILFCCLFSVCDGEILILLWKSLQMLYILCFLLTLKFSGHLFGGLMHLDVVFHVRTPRVTIVYTNLGLYCKLRGWLV
jgi:hypothetical protein